VLTSVIHSSQEAEIRRIEVQSQPGEIVLETLSKKPFTKKKKRADGVVQDVGSVFKPQYWGKKKSFHSSVQKAEAGGWQVRGHPELHSKTVSQKEKQNPFLNL
jgi:hypothetical protein